MTDNEIIKALECCADEMGCKKGCPCFNPKAKGSCCTLSKIGIEKTVLDLINRQKAEKEALIAGQETMSKYIEEQQAEIERLHSEVKEKTETIDFLKDQSVGWSIDFCNLKAKLNTAKAEAVKEFVMRFEKKIRDVKFTLGQTWEIQSALKKVEKEMVGDENG